MGVTCLSVSVVAALVQRGTYERSYFHKERIVFSEIEAVKEMK